MTNATAHWLALPIALVLKITAFSAAVPLVMLQLGFDWGDVRHIVRQAFFGFDIGNIRVSFASLFGALIVFVVAYTLARIFQEWLDRQVLAKAGMSGSARTRSAQAPAMVGSSSQAWLLFRQRE